VKRSNGVTSSGL